MDKQTQQEDELLAAQQAIEWLDTLEQGQPEDRQDFAEWLSRSPVNVQEFLTMTAIDRYLDHVPADYPLDVSRLRAANAPGKVANFTPATNSIQTQPLRTARATHLMRWSASAAALLVAAASIAWWMPDVTGQRYATKIGEQRTVELPDGSIVYLNARSSVSIRLDKKARDIYLTQGEALFKVKHEAVRPFRVHAEKTLIQAVGTQFNVYRRDRETRVAVLEGAVRISTAATNTADGSRAPGSARALHAGEEAHVVPAGQISTPRKLDIARTLAWRERRLVFDKTPLAEIAAEFNRYNREMQLRVEGDNAERRRFTGAFDADDPDSLVELLMKDVQLRVERKGDQVVIR